MNTFSEQHCSVALHYWCDRDRAKVYGVSKKEEEKYRNELAARECSEFALVRDIADAHKHFELDRKPRRLTNPDQTGTGTMGPLIHSWLSSKFDVGSPAVSWRRASPQARS